MSEKATNENRRALPRFALTMLGSLLAGGVIGFVVGCSRVFGAETAAVSAWVNDVLRAAAPWGVPVTSVPLLGGCLLLYRAAVKRLADWDGGDVDESSEAVEQLLSWVLLLSAVQLLLNLFFMAALAVYLEDNGLLPVGVFLLSCAGVIFAQQKAVDLERRMNPEKRGSVYDTKFQKKWMDSCDESERRQIGQACYRAYLVTSRVCVGVWLVLVILSMVFETSLLPVFVLLLVWGVMQVTYTLECMRLSKKGGA